VTTKKLVAIATLSSLQEGKPKLVKQGKTRLACIRVKGTVHVLEDACPHEGHPLSMGLVRDGVLTCPWHNWKFDLATGHCRFGGESARRIPSEVHAGEVFVSESVDAVAERERLERDLEHALFGGRVDGIVREGLRLSALDEAAPFEVLLGAALAVAPHGFGEIASSLEASRRLVVAGVLSMAEALAVCGDGLARGLSGRAPVPEPPRAFPPDRDAFLEALLDERRDEAIARALADERSFAEVAEGLFFPFVSLKLLDGGLSLVRVVHAERLARAFPRHERALRGAVARMLAWAVARSDLPAWRATRSGVAEALRKTPVSRRRSHQGSYEASLLFSEKRAVAATLDALSRGHDLVDTMVKIRAAACHRLAKFDVSWSTRVGSTVSVAEPVTALLFSQASSHVARRDPRLAPPLSVLMAGLVGRLARISNESSSKPDVRPTRDVLRDVVLASALSEASPELGVLAATALLECQEEGGDIGELAAPILAEPRHTRLSRMAANAERVVRTRKPHEGID
jgi:nitrite reductase/ring-hydroxylating ferredoxin subunit